MTNPASVYDAFRATSDAFSGNPFLHVPSAVARHYAIDAGEVTYLEHLIAINALIEYFRHAGYGPGHRVALTLDNRPAFIAHWFALNALGASVVPINSELSTAEQAYLLTLAEVDLLLHAAQHSALSLASVAKLETSIPVLCIDNIVDVVPPVAPSRTISIDRNTECAILFTSGSTGQPKACVLTNEYFLEMGDWYRDLGGLCALQPGRERLITPLPLTHMNAMATSLMAMLSTGGCLIQLDRFHPTTWWATVREARASVIHYLGVMPAILLQLGNSQTERDHDVKFGFGAGVNPAHHAAFEQRFGFPLIEAWAMTETGAGGCIAANREPRHVGQACFGKPDTNRIAARLVDERDRDVSRGQPGELLVRAVGSDTHKGYFKEYYRNPSATDDGWRDGWWHTGDVVRELDDGSLCFVDRRKNIIRRSGENIAALEVEAVLSRHPATAALAVTAAYDEIRGEEVMACIVLADNYPASEQTARDIFDHCCGVLAYFKTPGYVVFVESLPLTATQKPKRNEIRALAKTYISEPPSGVMLIDFRPDKRKPAR